MKKLILSSLITTVAALSLTVAAPAPLTVAVFDFEASTESARKAGGDVATLLNAYLSATPDLVLVERAELEKALGEQEMGLSGAVSSESAAKVGHLTGAKVLVTGKVLKLDKETMLVAKVIGTETSRVYGEVVKGPASKSLDELTMELSEKLSAAITAKAETLVAKPTTSDDRVQALNEQLKDRKRPVVSVRIPEQHYGAPVIDPAAQTELAMILEKCGFTVVDEKTGPSPEIEITGEAFSAFGMRRGNLASCKARVELKALRKADGMILGHDRQTTVAIDLTEQTAAKTALENAAAQLASRFIPRLVETN